MTRRQAIDNILAAFGAMESEFCVGVEEHRQCDEEAAASLLALGVSPAEMGDYYGKVAERLLRA